MGTYLFFTKYLKKVLKYLYLFVSFFWPAGVGWGLRYRKVPKMDGTF